MKHIDYAIFILKNEIRNQKYLLDKGHNLPDTEERINGNLQLLEQAVNDIESKFEIKEKFHQEVNQYLKDRGWK